MQEHDYFEDAFKVYERGVNIFVPARKMRPRELLKASSSSFLWTYCWCLTVILLVLVSQSLVNAKWGRYLQKAL